MKALLIILFVVAISFITLSSVLSTPKEDVRVSGKLSPNAVFLYKYTKGDTSISVYSTKEVIKVY